MFQSAPEGVIVAGGVSATKQRRHGARYGAARVERDVLIATIDVCNEEWQQAAAAHAAQVVGREALGKVTDAWSPDLCSELAAIAAIIQEPDELARTTVEWFVASIAMAHGIPPFIARVLGRLVANWLFAPNDLDTTAERVRVLGVLLCVMNGDLDGCPCLAELGEAVAVDELERKLREDLNVSPQPGEPTAVRVEPMRFATVTHEARTRGERPRPTRAGPEASAPAERSHDADRSAPQSQERDRAAEPATGAAGTAGPRPGPQPTPPERTEPGSGPPPGDGPDDGPHPGTGGFAGTAGPRPGPQPTPPERTEPGSGPPPGDGPDDGPHPGTGGFAGTAGPRPRPQPTPPERTEPGSGPPPGDEPDDGPEPGTGWRPVHPPGRPPGRGPAGAEADEADPRLIAACDRVRGARYVPPPATFGAAPNPR